MVQVLAFLLRKQHRKLPVIAEEFTDSDTVIVVQDSKAGWARAFRELLAMLYGGQIPKVDVTRVRPAGARLKTMGGRASGAQPLVNLLTLQLICSRKQQAEDLMLLKHTT